MDAASLTMGAADAAIRLRDAEDPASPYHGGSLVLAAPTRAEITLDSAPAAWWRDRPLRLEVGTPARDQRGNAMATTFEQVFFPGAGGGLAGGFLYGEAWDDLLGRPLGEVRARLYSGAAGAGAPLFEVQTDGRGRYTFAGEVPAGRYAVLLERPATPRWCAGWPSSPRKARCPSTPVSPRGRRPWPRPSIRL